MKLKTYVINLKESESRREYILGETGKYPFMDVELVDAVNGRQLSVEETDRLFDRNHFMDRYNRRIPYPGEIGCTLSHRECYKRLLASGEEVALILEDDMAFLYPEKIASYYTTGIDFLHRNNADILISGDSCLYYKKRKKQLDGYDYYEVYSAYGTQACLVTRHAAAKILAKDSYPSILADDYRALRRMGLKIYQVLPVMTPALSEFPSTINFKIQYSRRSISFRFLYYRLINWWEYLRVYPAILTNRLRDSRLPYLFWVTPTKYINVANGL